MQFINFDIQFPNTTKNHPIINRETIDRLENDIKNNQNLRVTQIFIEKLNFDVPAFDSLDSYERFIRFLKYSNQAVKNDTQCKLLNIFRNKFGLPFFSFDCDLTLWDRTKTKSYGCSKEIMENYSFWFKTMLTSGLKESHTSSVDLDLSAEGIECLLQYVYTKKITLTRSIEVLREVYQFADSALDQFLVDYIFPSLLESYLDDKNDEFFDAEFITHMHPKYIELYLVNKKINFGVFKNNSYSIKINDFNILFQKQSNINNFIIKKINTLTMDEKTEMHMSFLIKKRYREKILNINFNHKPSFYEFHALINIFNNFYFPISFFKKLEMDTTILLKCDMQNEVNYLIEWIKIQPLYDFAYAWLHDFYFENKRYVEAEKYIRSAIELNSFKSIYLLKLSEILFLKNEINEAEFQLKKAIHLNPSEEIYKQLGKITWITKSKEAIIYLCQTLMVDSKDLNIQSYLGNIKDWRGAGIYFQKLLEIDPESSKNNVILCRLANDLHAIKEITIVSQFVSPDRLELFFKMNLKSAGKKRLFFLYEQFTEFLKSYESSIVMHMFLWNICLMLDKSEEAKSHFKKGVGLNTSRFYYLEKSCPILIEWNIDLANKFLIELLTIKPEETNLHLLYIEKLNSRNQYEMTLEHLIKLIKIQPNSDILNAKLGEVYFFKQKYSKALKFIRRALEINPEFSFAFELFEKVKSILKDKTFLTK